MLGDLGGVCMSVCVCVGGGLHMCACVCLFAVLGVEPGSLH